ncbi:unnamed protein product [Closterium sp. NIES-53]
MLPTVHHDYGTAEWECDGRATIVLWHNSLHAARLHLDQHNHRHHLHHRCRCLHRRCRYLHNGSRGRDGSRGRSGSRGHDGSRGRDGSKGRDGSRGRDGSGGRDSSGGRDGSRGLNGSRVLYGRVRDGRGHDGRAEIYAGAMAAQELRRLTYLLTDLGEQPRSPPVLYVDNKAMISLNQEHKLEHRTKHIDLRYFLA